MFAIRKQEKLVRKFKKYIYRLLGLLKKQVILFAKFTLTVPVISSKENVYVLSIIQ